MKKATHHFLIFAIPPAAGQAQAQCNAIKEYCNNGTLYNGGLWDCGIQGAMAPYVDCFMGTRGAVRTCVPPEMVKSVALRVSSGSSMLQDDLSHEVIALMILYALPAPFIIPLFADVGEEGKYISTSLSVHTLCTILLFVAIAAFSLN